MLNKTPIYLDAATLLGSGQTVRLAIAFAAILQRPIILQRIREQRDNPGLKEHHILAVKTIAKMMDANIEGARIGSNELFLNYGKVKRGTYRIKINGNGSAVNILESIMLPAFFSRNKIMIIIEGGTFFPWVHFNLCVVPLLRKIGVKLTTFHHNTTVGALIEPAVTNRLILKRRGKFVDKHLIATGKNLLSFQNRKKVLRIDYQIIKNEKLSFTIISKFLHVAFGFDGILGSGKEETSEEEIIRRADTELNTTATVDTKTAEQIIPWVAVNTESFYFRVAEVTEHLETALWLIETMLKKRIFVRKNYDCYSIFSKEMLND